MITKVKLKAWGNSLGAIIPKEIVNQIGLKEGEEVEISLRPVTRDIKRLFGKYHTDSAQEAKDEMRRGWADEEEEKEAEDDNNNNNDYDKEDRRKRG
jgi:antitoxin component of MazEF toxin-antitoxin module